MSIATIVQRWTAQERATGVPDEHLSFGFEGSGARPILLLHGLRGSPSDFVELAQHLSGEGHPVLCPLLPHHGRTHRELGRMRFADLVDQALAAFDELAAAGSPPVVIGQSLGAVVGVRLVTEREVPTLVALAPAFRPFVAFRAFFLLPMMVVRPGFARAMYAWQMEARRGILTTRERLAEVRCPLLVFHSLDDRSVSVEGSRELFARVSSENKSKHELDGQGHVLSLAPDRTELIDGPLGKWLDSIVPEGRTRTSNPLPADV